MRSISSKQIVAAAISVIAVCSCEQQNLIEPVVPVDKQDYLVAPLSVQLAPSSETKAFDESLNWQWEAQDEILAFQCAGDFYENTLTQTSPGVFKTEDLDIQ